MAKTKVSTLNLRIEPGEVVEVKNGKVHSRRIAPNGKHAFCIFEYIYFARPDSQMEGHSVYEMRKNIGMELAKESPVKEADLVVPVVVAHVEHQASVSQFNHLAFIDHLVGRRLTQHPGFATVIGVDYV